MNIPVANIYFLLCYAWDKLEESTIVDVRAEDEKELVDLLTRVLCTGTRHLLRRGIDRGYLLHEEAIPGIRGKFVPAVTIKQNLRSSAKSWCNFDELSHDVIHNQILKATLRRLVRHASLDVALREEARDVLARLPGISDIRLSPGHFRLVQLHRNNAFYGFLLEICEFVVDNLMLDEEHGTARFHDFIRDETRMRVLFERFVFNFFQREQNVFTVSAPQIDWAGADRLGADAASLPFMQTDVVLRSSGYTLIIDTKFTPRAFSSRFNDKERARSEHLYQVFSYVKNFAAAHPEDRVDGMLLYPVIDEPFEATWPLSGHTMSIRSIDLNQPWRVIEAQMKELVSALPLAAAAPPHSYKENRDGRTPSLFQPDAELPATLTLYSDDDSSKTARGQCKREGGVLRWIGADGASIEISISDIYEDAEDVVEGFAPGVGHFRIELQPTLESVGVAPTPASSTEDARYFTAYWSNETWQRTRDFDDGTPLSHLAADAFRGKNLRPGDVFYVVTVIDGVLHLGARVRAASVVDQETAESLIGQELWEAEVHIVGEESEAEPMLYDLQISEKRARGLEFIAPDGQLTRLKFVEPGKLDQQTLRVPRQLSAASAQILDDVLADAHRKRLANRSFDQLRAGFLKMFPAGFQDPKYLEEERNYKVKACEQLRKTIGRDELEALIADGAYDEVVRRAGRVVQATNLLYKSEIVALKEGLDDHGRVEAFAKVLHDLLYGSAPFRERFERFARVLEQIGAASWPTATYFPFLADPAEHMFLKPRTTRAMAAACQFDLRYHSALNFETYSRLQGLTAHLQERLADLEPRDNIDVHSFMWRAVKYE